MGRWSRRLAAAHASLILVNNSRRFRDNFMAAWSAFLEELSFMVSCDVDDDVRNEVVILRLVLGEFAWGLLPC